MLFRINIIFFIGVIILFFLACEKEVTLDLPSYESELVVESYLEVGLPYFVSLTESVSFFDAIELPIIPSATVTITHKGIVDTLEFVDSLGVYLNLGIIVQENDYEPFELNITDENTGRTASASTQFLPIIPIDTVVYRLNDSSQASIIQYFDDDAATEDFYKVFFTNINTFDTDSTYTWEFTDKTFSGQRVPVGMGFNYRVADTVAVRLYHITQDYYKFLESASDAENASESPLSRPSRLISNINDGLGIFTTLVYDEKILIINDL